MFPYFQNLPKLVLITKYFDFEVFVRISAVFIRQLQWESHHSNVTRISSNFHQLLSEFLVDLFCHFHDISCTELITMVLLAIDRKIAY